MVWVRIKVYNKDFEFKSNLLINTNNINSISRDNLNNLFYVLSYNNVFLITDEEGKRKICKIKI